MRTNCGGGEINLGYGLTFVAPHLVSQSAHSLISLKVWVKESVVIQEREENFLIRERIVS